MRHGSGPAQMRLVIRERCMTEDSVIVVVETVGEADTNLATRISEETASSVRTVTRHGLGGDASTWLLIGNFVATSFATLAPIVSNYIKERRVKSIKVGDLAIENPRPEDVEKMLQAWQSRGSTGPT